MKILSVNPVSYTHIRWRLSERARIILQFTVTYNTVQLKAQETGVRLGTGRENEAPGRKCNFCSLETRLVKSSLDEPWMTWNSCVVWINWKSCLMKCRLKVTVFYFQNFMCIFIQFNIQYM